MYCDKHQIYKNHLYCLEDQCSHRFTCIQCHIVDRQHNGHNYIVIKEFIRDDHHHEIQRTFHHQYLQLIQNTHSQQSIVQMLDHKINTYLDHFKHQIRNQIDKIIKHLRSLTDRWKFIKYQEFNASATINLDQIKQNMLNAIENNDDDYQQLIKQQIDQCNQIGELQNQLDNMLQCMKQSNDQIINELDMMGNQYRHEFDRNMGIYMHDMTEILKLSKCHESVQVFVGGYEFKHKILEYEQNNQQYKICIDLCYCGKERILELMDIINQLNVNHKVGKLDIFVDNSYNELNEQIVDTMIDRYKNLYSINMIENSDQVDENTHCWIKKLVGSSKLLHFLINTDDGKIYDSDEGLKLIKEYNRMMKGKQYLKYLGYFHRDVYRSGVNREQVRQMIDEVDII